ncbi:hypothetical protein RJT34_12740 [Clitoria ternatea]|uniref:Uncharacterized protein n=1 Tax=Clitoria ternatea TaxID=43366 RepID=A0AAN9PL69_CLITE
MQTHACFCHKNKHKKEKTEASLFSSLSPLARQYPYVGFMPLGNAAVIALLRLDKLYIESFETKDVKILEGDRAIGRLSGKGGKTSLLLRMHQRQEL